MTNNNNKNNRILLVDDEVDITTVFTLALADNGFEVDAFNDPIQALSGFRSGSYDLALIDYKMPNMNGFELYREIRKIDERVKVCFITAFEVYHEELKKKFQSNLDTSPQYKQEIDVKCFIQKPIDIDDLVKRIKEELNSLPEQSPDYKEALMLE
ncbi:MAG TPA: response regulator [Candidatus Acidoferrum sp.]|nr:response regulator [Candidatus Acidoferrum sp.]